MASPALHSSDRMDWRTPPRVLDAIQDVWGWIDLDPCTSEDNPIGAEAFYTPRLDGLARPWLTPGVSLVYMNPPYGRQIGKWTDKARHEFGFDASFVFGPGPGTGTILGLVPARPDTKWWDRADPTAVIELRGRLRFVGATAGAPFPSAVLCWTRDGLGPLRALARAIDGRLMVREEV